MSAFVRNGSGAVITGSLRFGAARSIDGRTPSARDRHEPVIAEALRAPLGPPRPPPRVLRVPGPRDERALVEDVLHVGVVLDDAAGRLEEVHGDVVAHVVPDRAPERPTALIAEQVRHAADLPEALHRPRVV